MRVRFLGGLFSVALAVLFAGVSGAEIVCEGTYGGHLQGLAATDPANPEQALCWSFTVDLVKTDMAGKVLKRAAVPKHHGDLAYDQGKVYVAVNLGEFNQEAGQADSWVYVYDAGDLSLLSKHEVQEVVHGAGGIECHDGRFFVVGGLPEGYSENYVYEYDETFTFAGRHVIDSGYTRLGIQTTGWFNGYWWFGCYGNPPELLQTDDAFRLVGRYQEKFSVGVAGVAGNRCLQGISQRVRDKRWTGRAVFALPGTSKAAPNTKRLLAAGGEPVRVVCFGDSVTGVYYHTGGRRAYADMLEVALRRGYPGADAAVINAGVSGHTTVNALARIEKDVLAHKPHLVTVMFGLNDMVRVPLDAFENNLGTIVQRCRDIGAEVLLCTPNAVYDTETRPTAKLEDYVAAIRRTGEGLGVYVVDCHRVFGSFRARDPLEFAVVMSDEIHPNMTGHKRIAETIAAALGLGDASLADVGPPDPAIPNTLALLDAGDPVKVYAMPPFDALIGPALRQLEPAAQVEVTAWPVEGRRLTDIEAAAKQVRKMDVDLVVVAVPAGADADTPEQFIRSYSWVLNWALSFGRQEWDCFAAAPSAVQPDLNDEERERDRLARTLIEAQDLGMLERPPGDDRPIEALLVDWLRKQGGAGR